MNINLKNRTIFTKMFLGFMLILVVAALMGGVMFYSLGSVTGVLRQITERNAPSIRYPTGVERYALRTILDEKNYLLLQKKEIHEQAMRDIQGIYANLDRVDEVAARYNDQTLLQESGDVRRTVDEYREHYNLGVAILEKNQKLSHNMRLLGRKVCDLSQTHTLGHKRLMEGAVTNGIDQTKHMEVFHLCNEIEKEVMQARREEKNYIIYKKQEYFDGLKEHIANLRKLLDAISKINYVLEHQPLIEETRRATDEYLAAAEKWVANDNELRELLIRMHEIGLKVQETALSVQEAGWQEMDKSKKKALLITQKASLTGILLAVITLITGILGAFFMARGIADPIKELSRATNRIAEGDLSHRVRVQASDEIGQLGISFNKMSESLQKTMVSQNYFDNIIKSMMDTIIVLDKKARIETVNQATCDLLGYTEQELTGQPASILFAEEEEVYRVFQFFREPEKAGVIGPQDTIRNCELTYKTKDERLIPMLFNASVLLDKTGNITGVVAGAKDITDLKLAEAEIRKEKTFSENIIATIPDSLLVLDKDLRIKSANRTFYETFQTGPDKVIEARITEILGDEDGRLSTELTRLFGTEDIIKYFELRYHSEKLGERIFNITARNIIFAEEEEEEELLVIRDITGRKQAEEALLESEKCYRLLAENVTDVIWTIDMDLRFSYISPSVKRFRGYSVEETMAQTLDEILTPASSEVAMKTYIEEMAIEEIEKKDRARSLTLDLEHTCKDGSTVWAEVKMSGIRDSDGRLVKILGVTRDITERRLLEAQFLQAQKMEAVGRLAGGIAHDFNNLLTIVIGNSDLLLETLKRDDPSRKDVEEIKKAGERGASLIRQILAFSRRQVLQPKVLNLNTVIEDMEKMLRRMIGEDIEIVLALDPEPGRVKMDPGQMEQVIMNLAVNARDAMPLGGKMTIETANVNLDKDYAQEHGVKFELKPGPYVMLSLSDTGIGMDKETREHIFEPFFTTKEKGKGTGLGLSTVYGIIKQSDGYIWCYSKPGQGTVFKIYLPRVEAAEEAVQKGEVEESLRKGSETILMVEDDEALRNLAIRVLREQGYTVLEAQDGEEALKVSERHKGPIHLLLTDVVIPGMNGRELEEHLRNLRPRMKVIFMSGYTDDTLIRHDVLDGEVTFVQKPFTPETLGKKVREVLVSAKCQEKDQKQCK